FLADELSVTFLRQLTAVVHEEAARARELVSLARQDAHREFFTRQVRPGQLHAFGDLVGVDVDGADALVYPARLQFLQAVLSQVVVCLAWAVVVGGHGSTPSPSSHLSSSSWSRRANVTPRRHLLCPFCPKS